MADGGEALSVRGINSVSEIDQATWDRLAFRDGARTYNPFVAYEFLRALEDSGSVGEETGWTPCHLQLETTAGEALALAPAYLKNHSYGEYVFDHAWAEAYMRAGGNYYPKLQIAAPFTPVPGPRFLGMTDTDEIKLAIGATEFARHLGVSSVHATFLEAPQWSNLADVGYLQRMDQQFHWTNAGYTDFDDYLASLASRKRKSLRKERARAVENDIEIEWRTGVEIEPNHWDAFFNFYMDTGARKWGAPYLNRAFFDLLGERMGTRVLLILAKREGKYVAGALNLIGGDALYGRYWGCTEHHPFLHFELCYYQAIDFAISTGLKRVEAGAQGDHKLARGYEPTPTYSAHWIANASFRKAVADYLDHERQQVACDIEALASFTPFKKTDPKQ